MWARNRIFLLYALLAVVVFYPTFLCAQGFEGDVITNIPGRPGCYRLSGHVKIVHNGNTIYSDYADYEQATGSCQAYGNLRIFTKDKVKITGEVLDYNGRTGSYIVDRNVEMDNGEMTMETPSLRFEGSTNTAYYDSGGTMVSGKTVMTSRHGYYEGRKDLFHCFEEVVIIHPDYIIRTDTLHYNKNDVTLFQGATDIETEDYFMFGRRGWFDQNENKVSLQHDAWVKNRKTQILYGDSIYYDLDRQSGEAFRNVFLLDTARSCYIKSDYAKNDETDGFALFEQSPHGLMIESGDTLYMSGDRMLMTYDSAHSAKEIFIYHRVKIFREDMQGICDSLVYHHRDSLMYMYKEPVLWIQGYQIDGDTVKLYMRNNKPHKALIRNNVMVVNEVSARQNFYNQIRGRRMWGYFNDSSRFELAHVIGNAQSIYYVLDDKNALIGVNKTESESLKMYFRNNQVYGVNVVKPVSSVLHKLKDLTQRQRLLKGFHWKAQLQPKSKYDLSENW